MSLLCIQQISMMFENGIFNNLNYVFLSLIIIPIFAILFFVMKHYCIYNDFYARYKKYIDMDDYDFFLWGARALLTIKNPSVKRGEKLLVFRDSFGSSIAPLLAEYYEEVTLVDLRYVSVTQAMKQLSDKEYDTVLFLYSASILNHSDSMKFY